MKILQATIRDFISIGQAELSLGDMGLVLIQGVNEVNPSAKSNGAGKSSIVDAICWCLFGETARGLDGDGVIRWGAKEASVTLLLDDEGQRYMVNRLRRKGRGALALSMADGEGNFTINCTAGTDKLTQEALVKILGYSSDVFCSAIYIGQEQMPDLPRLTDKRLKELIEQAAGVEVLEAAYTRAKQLALEAEKAAVAQAACVDQATRHVTFCEGKLTELDASALQWIKDWSARLHAAGVEEEALNRALDTALEEFAGWPDPKPTLARLAEIDRELAGFTDQQRQERLLAAEVSKAERAMAAAETTARLALKRHAEAQHAAQHAGDHVGEPCDACGQPLTADALRHAVAAAARHAGACKAEATGAAGALLTARKGHAAAAAALAEFRAGMSDPTKAQAEREALNRTLETYNRAVRAVEEARRKCLDNKALRDRLGVEVNPYEALLVKAGAEVEKARTQLVEETRLLEAARTEHEIQAAVAKVFGTAGVRAHVLDQVTPYLNDRTSAYLDILSDSTIKAVWTTLVRNAKGELKEKFSIEVTHPNGEGFQGLSGGEKRKVRIACALALQDLVASRATKPFSLWVADEIDDALDDAGLERLMAVLQEKAREKGTVLVISHNNLTDWIDTVWVVTKREDRSEVTI